jgi:hypothetical protein
VTIRVTAAQKKIAAELLATRGIDDKDFVERLLMEVITANDEKTRYAVVVWDEQQRSGEAPAVFGPYATVAAAHKAVATGLLASRPGARGFVVPLITAPKRSEWSTALDTVHEQRDR